MYFVLCTFVGEDFKSSNGDRYVHPNGGLLFDEYQHCQHVVFGTCILMLHQNNVFTVLCDQKLAHYANV